MINTKRAVYLLLTLILFGHFAARVYLDANTPLVVRHFYPMEYIKALAWSQGWEENIALDPEIEAQRVALEFLKLQRSSLSPEELSALAASQSKQTYPFVVIFTSRPFELRVGGLLWSIFGVSWQVISYFYIALSTLSCFCIYLSAASISGRNWVGLISALAYALTPAELWHTIWSIRDVNTTYFFSFALAFCLRSSGIWRTTAGNVLSYFLLGVVSLLGIGWRADALFITPLIAAFMAIQWYRNRWRKSMALAYFVCFVLGVAAIWQSHHYMLRVDKASGQHYGTVTHIGVYADHIRSNLGGYENFFQALRCDSQVLTSAWHLYGANQQDIPYMSKRYGEITQEILTEQASYNAYRWVRYFPSLYSEQIWRDLFTGYLGSPIRFPALANAVVFILLLAGIATAFLIPRSLEALMLIFFSMSYTTIYWIMLPEVKHITPLAVPWAVLFGLACLTCVSAVNQEKRKKFFAVVRSTWKPWAFGVLALVLLYAAALGGAHIWSSHKRQEYLGFIRANLAQSVPVPVSIVDERIAAVYFKEGALTHDHGMVWEIETDGNPGLIEMQTRLQSPLNSRTDWFFIPKKERKVYLYKTVAQLAPARNVISETPFAQRVAAMFNRERDATYEMLISLPPGSRFVSAMAFPILERGILPFQTLYTAHDTSPGSPRIRWSATALMGENDLKTFESLWQDLNVAAMVPVQ